MSKQNKKLKTRVYQKKSNLVYISTIHNTSPYLFLSSETISLSISSIYSFIHCLLFLKLLETLRISSIPSKQAFLCLPFPFNLFVLLSFICFLMQSLFMLHDGTSFILCIQSTYITHLFLTVFCFYHTCFLSEAFLLHSAFMFLLT